MGAKIIAIEGLDAVGKRTQSKWLETNLKNMGYKVAIFSWPNYNGESSAFVKKYLAGEYEGISRKAVCMLFAMDRYLTMNFDEDFKKMMEDNDYVIFDRYIGSNIICQCGLLESEIRSSDEFATIESSLEKLNSTLRAEKYALARWIFTTEHGDLGLPEPDMTIYLDLKPDIAYKLMVERSESEDRPLDIHETFANQLSFSNSFEQLTRYYSDTYTVNCNKMDENFKAVGIKDVSEISRDVLRVVENYLINKN